MQKHAIDPDILRRLKRAQGHLKSTIDMLEAGRECLDIAQQLQAVERALVNAKRELIHGHIGQCLEDDTGSRAVVRELKSLAKFLS